MRFRGLLFGKRDRSKGQSLDDYYSIVSNDRIECADLTEETRRIARHLVRDGLLHAHEYQFEPTSEHISFNNLQNPQGSMPHFCNDCAHQGTTIIRPKESLPKQATKPTKAVSSPGVPGGFSPSRVEFELIFAPNPTETICALCVELLRSVVRVEQIAQRRPVTYEESLFVFKADIRLRECSCGAFSRWLERRRAEINQ